MATKDNQLAVLRKAYASIIQGYVATTFRDAEVFLRHFSPLEQAEVDDEYLKWFDRAVAEGLSTEEKRLESLIATKLWEAKTEEWIKNQRIFLEGLNTSKRAQHLPSQVKIFKQQIDDAQKQLDDKLAERRTALGLTAEGYASQKVNEIYIYKTLYKDKGLVHPFFTADEYEWLDREDISQLVSIHNNTVLAFNDAQLKKIALAPFFQEAFALCEGNVKDFYGYPIVRLTYYQSALASYGLFFRSIFSSENRPPFHIMDDPDAVIDWVSTKQNSKQYMGKPQGEGGGMSLVGGTKEDMEQLGINQQGVSLQSIAKGKNMSMHEMMAAQGINLG